MTLVELVRLVRRNIVFVLICGLVVAAILAAWSLTRPEVYRAVSTGIVTAGDTQSVTSATSGDMLAMNRASSYSNLMNSRAVAKRVKDTLAARPDKAPVGSYSAFAVPGTAFIQVAGTGATAIGAQATADAALAALVSEALRMETYGTVQSMGGGQKSDEEMARLTSIHILPYEPAFLPTQPQRQDLIRNTGIGFGVGIIIGLIAAVVRRKLDVRVRTQSDVEELTGHSVLGVIPDSKELRERGAGVLVPTGYVGEALRKLRTNLRYVNVDSPPRIMVVTSANPGEGKSSISSNVARLIAMSGQKVVMVDCDLRRPVQADIFGVDASIGVAQVLAGDVTVEDALIQTQIPGLQLLPAGRIPPNPSELIGSQKMADLMQMLAEDATVIIDAPPILAVTDAALLSANADGALFVTVVGKTPKELVRQCAFQLELLGATFLGTVMNRVTRAQFGDVLYGYGYGSYYYYRNRRYYSSNRSDSTEGVQEAVADAANVVPAELPDLAPAGRRAANDVEVSAK